MTVTIKSFSLYFVFFETFCSSIGNIFSGIDSEKDALRTFISFGFTSLQAAELALKAEHLKNRDLSLTSFLLSETTTIQDFLDLLSEAIMHHTASDTTHFELRIEDKCSAVLEWEYNLEQCIDSRAVVSGE